MESPYINNNVMNFQHRKQLFDVNFIIII